MPDATQARPVAPTASEDVNRRRLTRAECDELLSRPTVGVFSSLAEGGWIHSVPVHFLYREGEIRILCGTRSVKASNVYRTGRGTLCVEVTDGSERRYVTVEGAVRVERPARPDDVTALDRQYSRSDTAHWIESNYADEAMLVMRPTRWIAWSDWD